MLKHLYAYSLIFLFALSQPLIAMEIEYDTASSSEEDNEEPILFNNENVFNTEGDRDMHTLDSLADCAKEDFVNLIPIDYTKPLSNNEESAIAAALDELKFGRTTVSKTTTKKKYKKSIQRKVNPAFPTAFSEKNNELIQFTHDIKEVRDICTFAIKLIASLEANGSEQDKQNMLQLLNEKQMLAIEALQKIDQIGNPTAYFLENFSSSIPQTVDNFLKSLGYTFPEDASCKL